MYQSQRQLGAAMTETVLILPLIFLVLALLFFFGQAMTRLQRASATDRYEAWRQAQYAPGPGAGFDKNPTGFDDNNLLNEAFFAGNAERVDIGERAGRVIVRDVIDTLADQALVEAKPSGDPVYEASSAEDFVRARNEYLPAWWRVELETEHGSGVPLYQRYAGPIKHQHTVIDGDWVYGSWIEQLNRGERKVMGEILTDDVHYIGDLESGRYTDGYRDLDDLRPHGVRGVYETYYTNGLDDYLYTLHEGNDNSVAFGVRLIYLSHSGYRGPQVLPELGLIGLWYRPQPNPDPGVPIDEDEGLDEALSNTNSGG